MQGRRIHDDLDARGKAGDAARLIALDQQSQVGLQFFALGGVTGRGGKPVQNAFGEFPGAFPGKGHGDNSIRRNLSAVHGLQEQQRDIAIGELVGFTRPG